MWSVEKNLSQDRGFEEAVAFQQVCNTIPAINGGSILDQVRLGLCLPLLLLEGCPRFLQWPLPSQTALGWLLCSRHGSTLSWGIFPEHHGCKRGTWQTWDACRAVSYVVLEQRSPESVANAVVTDNWPCVHKDNLHVVSNMWSSFTLGKWEKKNNTFLCFFNAVVPLPAIRVTK